jgi:CubicO group peptidase (beta-lactamase class C family)
MTTRRSFLTQSSALLLASGLRAEEKSPCAISAKTFAAGVEYSQKEQGVSLLVMHRGQVLFEDYHNGFTSSKPHMLASGTKSFSGVLAIAAEQDGLLTLDEKLSDTLTEWRDSADKSQLTIRQLLSLTSGIGGGVNLARPPSYKEAVKTVQITAAPGKKFQYGPISFQVWGEILRRKLEARSETVEGYLRKRILDPLNLAVAFWSRDTDGNPNLPSGAYLTAREWVKFGEFVRLQGTWKGQSLIPADKFPQLFNGTEANKSYGLTFWLKKASLNDAALATADYSKKPKDLVMAAGLGKQRCYIVPSLELVVVRMGNSERSFQDADLWKKLLGV